MLGTHLGAGVGRISGCDYQLTRKTLKEIRRAIEILDFVYFLFLGS